MRFGACIGSDHPEQIITAKKAGIDYIEGKFAMLSRADDDQFLAFKDALEDADIRCEAANQFIPGDLPLVGKAYSKSNLTSFIEKGMDRGAQIGLKTVVLGSGAARSYPDYMTFGEGFFALSRVICDVIAPIADNYGVTIVIEPLRSAECKIINTVKEGVMLASAARKVNVSGLGDLFHMVCEGDTFDDIRQLRGNIKHAHISYPVIGAERPDRSYPVSADEFDYKGFIEALEYSGCPRCSIEGRTDDFNKEIFISAALLKELNK